MTETDADSRPRYHHGDLHAALLAAGEAELAEAGIEAFSLRSVARRAGVSHAAPAHHFGDVQGLLSALAAEGFRLFLAAQMARQKQAADDPRSQMLAAGLGYVDFALARPALFRLMFSSDRPVFETDPLCSTSEAAFRHLEGGVAALGSKDPLDIAAIWATAHGIADLLASGRLKPLMALGPQARDAAVAEILRRVLPAPSP
ncbi:TetR/AcrR family transcriptional regulator [Tabrizicola sp. J26]|uniref:TetR/AcrR family transcriptional regulator n=1 Tax=Alitabrizicola rongguiensis TaxID=2909234 RepID=UPI001F1BB393|nr:TetR/AcrR family transcriptional regulator [Tabrizicola rongguiensis]MCF1710939.1 TetR/AcrR family transcriptional regulator [Tabrizicola rongguiensis]